MYKLGDIGIVIDAWPIRLACFLIKLAMEAGASEPSLAEVALCQSKDAQQQLLRKFVPIRY